MNIDRIRDVVEPVLAEVALELDDLVIVPAGRRSVVRIVVDGDGPQGRGPLLDDIGRATRRISDALDASDATGDAAYTLEVSSRGTSRPLSRPAHWRRNTGRLVKVRIDGEEVIGRIVSSDETGAVLDVDGSQPRIEFADAKKPLIQIEMNRPVDPDLDDVGSEDDDEDDEDDDELVDDNEE